jgi:prefoldin subunit 5
LSQDNSEDLIKRINQLEKLKSEMTNKIDLLEEENYRLKHRNTSVNTQGL